MKIQLLSDLHLETEVFTPRPAPGADLLVLAGDVDSTWAGLQHFADWPVPVLFVPGNHEFDRRDVDEALAGLRARCDALGLHMLERDALVLAARDGRRIRFLGTTRWCDFDLFGEKERPRAMRAASYFVNVMRSTRGGNPFDPVAVREEALRCRAWLAAELDRLPTADKPWDVTVVVTHFGPSLRSADPRYGRQPGTASFCNADDDLLAGAQLWIHGHLHCRHDYLVPHAGGVTRVVSNARGHSHKGESDAFDGLCCISV
ncbi:MAG: metallophosphoesterase [Aquabacterium sp.]|uniref:metallophosphoesterase n=1 Tax=Aquabacterium sp. TaxID=1872578 RepID=UPI0025CB955E|nr:metallophosphoesterase [uncultured Aquabacterium sp.]